MSITPFNPPNILRLIAESLPSDEQPQLKNPQDAIAIFTHACMLSVGFRLVGLSEDDRIGIHLPAMAPHLQICRLTQSFVSFALRRIDAQAVAVKLELGQWR